MNWWLEFALAVVWRLALILFVFSVAEHQAHVWVLHGKRLIPRSYRDHHVDHHGRGLGCLRSIISSITLTRPRISRSSFCGRTGSSGRCTIASLSGGAEVREKALLRDGGPDEVSLQEAS